MGGAVCPVCTLRLVFGVQFVLFVGVAVAGVVWFVPRDGVHVAACVWRAAGAVCRRRGGRGGSVCPAGRCARWGLCSACTWCCLLSSRWRTWRWTWWRGWCGMFRGTVCKLLLVFGVQLVLFVGVAVAGVVRFVPRDGVHVGVCVWRAPRAVCRRRGGGGGSVRPAGRCAGSGLSLACTWCRLSASRWRTWRWTWWRWLCGLSRGTVCKLPLVFVVQLVLFVVVAAADVALDVVVAAAVRFVPRDGLRGPTRLASGASWQRSEWGPLAGLGM